MIDFIYFVVTMWKFFLLVVTLLFHEGFLITESLGTEVLSEAPSNASKQINHRNLASILDISNNKNILESSGRGNRRRGRIKDLYPLKNTIYVLPLSPKIENVSSPWSDIKMPTQSYFASFEPPSDPLRWNQALLQASRGEQILLSRVLRIIQSPFDLWKGDIYFKWIHRISPHQISKINDLPRQTNDGMAASVAMLGYTTFEKSNHEGDPNGGVDLSMSTLVQSDPLFKFPSKTVAIGRMNENFGYLSTYFLNRTFPGYGFSFDGVSDPFNKRYRNPGEQVKKILDDPNLVMLVVNQHHNISHRKIISLPLGVLEPANMWEIMQTAVTEGTKKEILFYSGGSNWGFRPHIRKCIAKSFSESTFTVGDGRLSKQKFRMRLIGSMAVLCMPGQGYDTYRLWESLAAGAMPVVERGMGMDRTFYKLPILMLDDYADLSESILRTAYVEALYRADEWEYARMTQPWYERLIYQVATRGDIEPLMRLHPMSAEDRKFTRPLVPFTCDSKSSGSSSGSVSGSRSHSGSSGCGVGTKRFPKQSCAIDPTLMKPGYRWDWVHRAPDT